MIDADEAQGASLRIGTSVDQRGFTYEDYSISGTGRSLQGIFTNTDNMDAFYGKTLRVRIQSNALDAALTFNALGVIYQDTEYEQD